MKLGFLAAFGLCLWCHVLLLGCAGTPEYLAPRGGMVDPASLADADAIPYRTLTREDFKATTLPKDAGPYAKRIGALTCAHIMTTPDTRFQVRQTSPSSYEGQFENLAFFAKMDRKCSWWNPDRGNLPEPYVLQHEQIHFALTEIEARRLNAEAREIVADFRAEGSSESEVKEKVQAHLNGVIQEGLERLLERNREFDEDTSAKYAPEAQNEWFERVTEELEKSGGH